VVGVCVLAVAGVCGSAYYWYITTGDFTNRDHRITLDEIEAKVNQGVPPNATRQEVESWLASQGWDKEHGMEYYSAKEMDLARSPDEFLDTGLVRSQVYWTVGVVFYNPYLTPFQPHGCRVYLEFFFDKNDRLIKHSARPWSPS
jgi:hypothetical protein